MTGGSDVLLQINMSKTEGDEKYENSEINKGLEVMGGWREVKQDSLVEI